MKINKLTISELLKSIGKLNAKPGGGAVVITIANMAVNLILMMNKKDFGPMQDKADVSYETIIHISDLLSKEAENDIYFTNILIDEYKKGNKIEDKFFIDASRPQIRLNSLLLEAMEILGFYLEFGNINTLSDGEIANILLKSCIEASIPTIKLNLKGVSYRYNISEVIEQKDYLFNKNLEIIERRKA